MFLNIIKEWYFSKGFQKLNNFIVILGWFSEVKAYELVLHPSFKLFSKIYEKY